MFTGLVETIGEVTSTQKMGGDVRLTIAAPDYADRTIGLGDSIAVNGACLTVVTVNGHNFSFDVSIESINHTLIGEWGPGKKVNLEMALLPTTRLGGHLVSGHVDGLAKLKKLSNDARSWRMVFEAPADLQKYIAKKGSITVNGTSLTVNSVTDSEFDVNVIPHTFDVTTLGALVEGDQVHIEVDLIARYLERLLSGNKPENDGITESLLSDYGFS